MKTSRRTTHLKLKALRTKCNETLAATTEGGATPLYMASQQGHVEVVKTLLGAKDIEVNKASGNGTTPLYVASQNGQAEVAKALGAKPLWVYDLHSHGCVSFIAMMELARSLMTTSGAKTALICNAQTAAGRIFGHPDVRTLAQSAVPGDGCGVGLLVAGDERPVEHITVRCHAENASDMRVTSDDGRSWWEPGDAPFHIDFSRSKVATVVRALSAGAFQARVMAPLLAR